MSESSNVAIRFDLQYHEAGELEKAALNDPALSYLLRFAMRHGLKGAGGLAQMIVAISEHRLAEKAAAVEAMARQPMRLEVVCSKCKPKVEK